MDTAITAVLRDFLEEIALVDFSGEEMSQRHLFEDGFLDSYSFVELIGFIERRFSLRLSDADLADPRLSTLDGITALIAEKRQAA